MGAMLGPIREQNARWHQLDALRPHARYLSIADREEFDRLDRARHLRALRQQT